MRRADATPCEAVAGRRLGAVWDGSGVSFATRSRHATRVELCLHDDHGREQRRLDMERGDDGGYRLRVDGVGPGQRYGLRVHGPYDPAAGHRYNPAKLLVDPWARAVTGALSDDPAVLGHPPEDPDAPHPDPRDSAPHVPHAVVIDDRFDWGDDRPPATPWRDTVIYEAHVRGLTRRHPAVPPELRGTYLALAHPAVIGHLRALGVTALQLMPVQHSVSERRLIEQGLSNYWGYNPLAFSAPHAGYATGSRGEQVEQLREAVRGLHAAGIEVLLDVVFNHTAESDHLGPTLSLRGLDNAAYYRLDPRDRRRYLDQTGCGNTLDFGSPDVVELVIDSLCWWAGEMRVDGFRFDLATVLGRDGDGFRADAPFFERLAAEPVLRDRKMIAEPWDLGAGGYRLGAFPAGWAEWNDRFRDAVRAFWRGDRLSARELMARLTGSRDLLAGGHSVDFVTSHDGFTLADLTAYSAKRNWDNGEENRDGRDHNLSANWGAEGPTDDPEVRSRRRRARRAMLATLAVSGGVPMLSHGDELSRTQHGNNNAYCHDGPLTWIDWQLDEETRELLAFARRALELRRLLPLGPADDEVLIEWISGDGHRHFGEPTGRTVAALGILRSPAAAATATHDRSRPVPAGSVLVLLNGALQQQRTWVLPELEPGARWRLVLDSGDPERRETRTARRSVRVGATSVAVLAADPAPDDVGG